MEGRQRVECARHHGNTAADDVAVNGFLALVEATHVVVAAVRVEQQADDLPARPAKGGVELLMRDVAADFVGQPPPAFEMGLVAVDKDAVHIEDDSESWCHVACGPYALRILASVNTASTSREP